MKKTEETEKHRKKVFKIVLKAILIIVSTMIIILLPDILFQLRFLVKKIPIVKKIVYANISDKEYVQMMIMALINCVAVSVSIMAYYVARTTGRTQIEQHEQDIILSALDMEKNLKKNNQVIFDLRNGTGNIKELIINDELIKNGICLFSAKKITSNERETWQSYVGKVTSIRKYYDAGDDKKKSDKINEYCKKFFIEDSETMEYSQAMQTLIKTLKKIAEGE